MKTDPQVHLNFFDQSIAFFFPGGGVRRLAARNASVRARSDIQTRPQPRIPHTRRSSPGI